LLPLHKTAQSKAINYRHCRKPLSPKKSPASGSVKFASSTTTRIVAEQAQSTFLPVAENRCVRLYPGASIDCESGCAREMKTEDQKVISAGAHSCLQEFDFLSRLVFRCACGTLLVCCGLGEED
jgi:hypothetical protein